MEGERPEGAQIPKIRVLEAQKRLGKDVSFRLSTLPAPTLPREYCGFSATTIVPRIPRVSAIVSCAASANRQSRTSHGHFAYDRIDQGIHPAFDKRASFAVSTKLTKTTCGELQSWEGLTMRPFQFSYFNKE
jgi:hypothetical protein